MPTSSKPSIRLTSTLTAPLTQPSQTLESARDAGYDLSAAAGEPVDNAIEAGATQIRIDTFWNEDETGIGAIAFGDDGSGIDPNTLVNVLSLGYSTRYNSRKGMGRFGVGLKLASLSQTRRIEIYSKSRGEDAVHYTYFDLQEVKAGTQDFLTVDTLKAFPDRYAHLMLDVKTRREVDSGTLVVWSKVDRLQNGGRFKESVDEKVQDLTKFLARAYRRFIDKGLYVELEKKQITPHDPTFQLQNPRVIAKFKEDLRAEEIERDTIELDGHTVEWVVQR